MFSGLVGSSPDSTRWTVLVLDLQCILSVYLNRHYAYVKNIRLCANVFVKGLFTSDVNYQPGISASEARKLGLIDAGFSPMPKEMLFPLPKAAEWHDLYDYIKFPPDAKHSKFGIMGGTGGIPKVLPEQPHKATTVSGKDAPHGSKVSMAFKALIACFTLFNPFTGFFALRVRTVLKSP